MGVSKLSDFVTGRTLARDEPAVAILIRRRTNGYPDPVATAAVPPIDYDDRFTVFSLPLRGAVGSYGDFEPDEGQEAVDIACAMACAADWKQLNETALDWQKGATLWQAKSIFAGEEAPANREILGLAVMSAATFDLVIGQTRAAPSDDDITTVLRAIDEARSVPRDEDFYSSNAYSILRLSLYNDWTFADGSISPMPPFAYAMSTMDGRPISGLLRDYLLEKAPNRLTPAVIRGVAEITGLKYGLEVLNRPLGPSMNGGQSDNAMAVASLAANSLDQSVQEILDQLEEQDDDVIQDRLAELQMVFTKLEAARDKLSVYTGRITPGLRP